MSSSAVEGRAAWRVAFATVLSSHVVVGCTSSSATLRESASEPGIALSFRASKAHATTRTVEPDPAMDPVDWRFHAGAPPAGPVAVGEDGSVVVGTTEGYLHSLRADGAFQWSYALAGRVVGAPVVGAGGRIFVATSSRRIHALHPTGTEWWEFKSPVPIATGLAMGRRGALYFGGGDRHVWAVSGRAGARWRAPLRGWITAGPVVSPDGERIVAATSDGRVALLHGVVRRRSAKLGEHVSAPPAVADDGSAYVIAGTTLFALSADGKTRWTKPDVEFVAAHRGGVVAVRSDARVERLTLDGVSRGTTALAERAANAPSVSKDGVVYVPGDQGRLMVVDRAGEHWSARLARSPLLTPTLDPTRDRVVVASGDGTVVARSMRR